MELQWLVIFAIGCVNNVASLDCHQGFSVTILGVPFFHHSRNECTGDSVCFAQEVVTRFPHPGIEVKAQYGGCVTKGYSQALSCKKLFGEDSDLDPATVFNMLPGLDPIIDSVESEFKHNITEAYRSLFSNGEGTESFINGCFKLMKNLGINTEKAIPLKEHLVNLINVTLPRPLYWKDGVTLTTGIPQSEIDEVLNKFMAKLRQVIDSYKIDYPNSEFPQIVWRVAQYFNASYNLPPRTGCYYGHYALNFDMDQIDACVKSHKEASSKLNALAVDVWIDFQFAVLNELNFIMNLNLFEEILKAFPKYEFYLRLLRLLNREDIKEIYKIFSKYLMSHEDKERKGYLKMFVTAFNVTMAKITSKFGDFNAELRQRFAPKTCKFYACQSNFCNTHEKLSSVKEMVFSEFNEETPTNSKTSEAQKSPRVEHGIASSISDSNGEKSGGFTSKPQETASTTSSSSTTQSTNLLTAITMLVLRALI